MEINGFDVSMVLKICTLFFYDFKMEKKRGEVCIAAQHKCFLFCVNVYIIILNSVSCYVSHRGRPL